MRGDGMTEINLSGRDLAVYEAVAPAGVRCFSDGNRSGAPMTTVHASATADQYTIRAR